MAGTFAAWRLGTLQARALPLARELRTHGIRCAIVTVPWDMPSEAGVIDSIAGTDLRNTSSSGVMTFPFAVARQTREIRALNPRAVHVFKPKGYGGLAGQLLAPRIPLVIDSDDWEGDGGWNQAGNYALLQRRLFEWQERSLLRRADAVTAASLLLTHRAAGVRSNAPGTVTWVPNGLESAWARKLTAASLEAGEASSEAVTIALYSRFAEFPADWLPSYLATLSTNLPPSAKATVTLIGESPNLPDRFENLKIDQMGYVAYDCIPHLLGDADIAIFPYVDSLISRSKNSVKLLELMAAGCAVIASRLGDVPAVAGDAAVLLDTSDPEAFAVATVELQHNRQRVQRLSSAAQHRALSQFSIQSVTSRLVDAYRKAGVLPPCFTT